MILISVVVTDPRNGKSPSVCVRGVEYVSVRPPSTGCTPPSEQRAANLDLLSPEFPPT